MGMINYTFINNTITCCIDAQLLQVQEKYM